MSEPKAVAGLVGSFRTKTGAAYHRKACRFVKAATAVEVTVSDPTTRKLKACAVCKPHLSAEALAMTVKSVGKELLKPCGVCLKDASALGPKSASDAVAADFVVTKTGTKYHKASCRHAKGKLAPKAVKEAKVAAEPKAQPKREKKARRATMTADQVARVNAAAKASVSLGL